MIRDDRNERRALAGRLLRKRIETAGLLCVLLFLAGCGARTAISHYQLAAAIEPVAGTRQEMAGKLLGIGPVVLPEYLAQLKIVTRLSANSLAVSDNHRWAEPLADNLPRVLRENLSRLLATERMAVHPWGSGVEPDAQLRLQVIQLEGTADNAAHLVARWSVTGKDKTTILPERRSDFTVAAKGSGEEAMVAALSAAVADLCREIATGIRPLLRQ